LRTSTVATVGAMTPAELVASVRLDELCDDHRIVGAVAGISIGGERACTVHGTADVSTGTQVHGGTWFMAGSVTKAMTAVLVNREVALGTIHLDDTVSDHLPEFVLADCDDDVTVRHLLTHTAGFDGDIWLDLGEGEGALSRLVERLASVRQLSIPGHRFSYNNGAYSVLGRLLEVVTGATFDQLVHDHVAVPSRSGLCIGMEGLPIGDIAVGHIRTGDDIQPVVVVDPVQGPACLSPAGSRTWGRIDDLLAFGEMLLGRHGDDAMRRAVVAMREPQIEVPDPNNGGTMALGVFLDDRWGTPVVFHDGGVNGQAAYLRVLPHLDTALAVMCTGGVPQVFHRHVIAALAAPLGLTAPLGATERDVAIDTRRYVGRYASSSTQVAVAPSRDASGSLIARITWNANTPDVASTPWLPLRPVDDRAFLAALGGRDYVLLFPPTTERCDHVLAGLRLLPRASEEAD
jgi:CubicO group peptidase (beta-lactamase class C family)